MRRVSIRKDVPFHVELGEFDSWKWDNPRVTRSLKIKQVDRHEGLLWLVAKNPAPHTATHGVLAVKRGRKTEKLGLVLVCED